ncbi:DUF3558 family protein [Saccharopolyspora sp. CA-218241]|uniref:DUF3558 family protein n=1 Tax=Saccharopolyspora sp. CA-218241 TaxID=3240027 RepID=UPI003D976D73
MDGAFDLMATMRIQKVSITLTAAAAGLLLAGCSGGSSAPEGNPPSSEATNVLQNFDPCTVLTPEEIQSFGASPEGEPSDLGLGETGCDFDGEVFDFGILKAPESDQAYWEGQKNNFDRFEPNQVGSHAGFSGISTGGAGQGVCSQMMYVGSGTVTVDVTYRSDTMAGADPCAKAMEIAQAVEPKLPQ